MDGFGRSLAIHGYGVVGALCGCDQRAESVGGVFELREFERI